MARILATSCLVLLGLAEGTCPAGEGACPADETGFLQFSAGKESPLYPYGNKGQKGGKATTRMSISLLQSLPLRLLATMSTSLARVARVVTTCMSTSLLQSLHAHLQPQHQSLSVKTQSHSPPATYLLDMKGERCQESFLSRALMPPAILSCRLNSITSWVLSTTATVSIPSLLLKASGKPGQVRMKLSLFFFCPTDDLSEEKLKPYFLALQGCGGGR